MTPGILCPHCGGDQHRVVESRPAARRIRRRRQCPCGFRFSTEETALPTRRVDQMLGQPRTAQ